VNFTERRRGSGRWGPGKRIRQTEGKKIFESVVGNGGGSMSCHITFKVEKRALHRYRGGKLWLCWQFKSGRNFFNRNRMRGGGGGKKRQVCFMVTEKAWTI